SIGDEDDLNRRETGRGQDHGALHADRAVLELQVVGPGRIADDCGRYGSSRHVRQAEVRVRCTSREVGIRVVRQAAAREVVIPDDLTRAEVRPQVVERTDGAIQLLAGEKLGLLQPVETTRACYLPGRSQRPPRLGDDAREAWASGDHIAQEALNLLPDR